MFFDRVAEFRAKLDELDFEQYKLAARLSLNPPALNQYLRRRKKMSPELEARIAAELAKIEAERAAR